MRELIGEPVSAAEVVYERPEEMTEWTKNVCWRYYYEESFWDGKMHE